MAVDKYLDDGLDNYMTLHPDATDEELEKEALRLEKEYNTKTGPQRNLERAIAASVKEGNIKGTTALKAMKEGGGAFEKTIRRQGLESAGYGGKYNILGFDMPAGMAKVAEAVFPRTMRASALGESELNLPLASSLLDAASYPFRTAEAYMAKADPMRSDKVDILERMGQVDTGEFLPEMIRSPYNVMPASKIGQGLGTAAKPIMQRIGQYAKKGMLEQIPVTGMEQAQRIEQGGSLAPGEILTELGTGAITPLLGQAGKRVLVGRKTPEGVKQQQSYAITELAKSALSGMSGKSKQLLSYVGAREGKDAIKRMFKENVPLDEKLAKIVDYSENAEEVAGRVVDYVDKGFKDKFVGMNKEVKAALAEMGDLDVSDVVMKLNRDKKAVLDLHDPLRKTKGIVPMGYETPDANINEELKNYDNVIRTITGKLYGPQKFSMPASELYDVRKELDASINFDKSKLPTGVATKIYNIPMEARTMISNKLKKAGDGTSYKEAMKQFHDLLQTRDAFMKKINQGKSVDKVANFLVTLGNPNKIDNRIMADQLKDLIGKDLFKESQLLKLSKEYRDGLGIYTDISTGKALLAPVLGDRIGGKIGSLGMTAASSPMVAAPMTAGIEAFERGLGGLGPTLNRRAPIATEQLIGE